MEAAVRAFEDWEFRVLERESGIDEDESAAEEMEGGSEVEMEISCQQHVVNAAQVNDRSQKQFVQEFSAAEGHVVQVCSLSACHVLHVRLVSHKFPDHTDYTDLCRHTCA